MHAKSSTDKVIDPPRGPAKLARIDFAGSVPSVIGVDFTVEVGFDQPFQGLSPTSASTHPHLQ